MGWRPGRDIHDHPQPAGLSILQAQRSPAFPGAGAHSDQSQAVGVPLAFRSEAAAIVLDNKLDSVVVPLECDVGGGGSGMACDIGERLLGDSEEVGLGIHVEAPLILEITSNFHPGPLGEPLR